jgi:dethiobiotin synthetase
MKNPVIFTTGTDTGVGKTHVAAEILRNLRARGVRAAAFKPISCGQGGRNDAKIYEKIMDFEQPLDVINPIFLKKPLAPSVAARLDRRKIDFKKIFSAFKKLREHYEIVLVEGAGGLLVPIRDDFFVADLAKEMRAPILIVTRPKLGTLNHTILTVEAARSRNLRVLGLVINYTSRCRDGLAERTNRAELPKLCGAPLLGVVKFGGDARKICEKLFF